MNSRPLFGMAEPLAGPCLVSALARAGAMSAECGAPQSGTYM